MQAKREPSGHESLRKQDCVLFSGVAATASDHFQWIVVGGVDPVYWDLRRVKSNLQMLQDV